MYNERLEQLIDAALADGELTEKEKQILFKKAQEMGVDLDEFEMVLDARLFKLKKAEEEKAKSSAPKSNKWGDIKKCPACGAMIESFTTKCKECGYEFKNVEENPTIHKLFTLLNEVQENVLNRIAKDMDRQSSTSILDDFNIFKQNTQQLARLRRDEEIDKKKKYIIQNFPIPNTKDDILEFLALAVPLAKKRSIFSSGLDPDGYKFYRTWKAKCEQIMIKAKFSMKDDEEVIRNIENYAKVLKIKL